MTVERAFDGSRGAPPTAVDSHSCTMVHWAFPPPPKCWEWFDATPETWSQSGVRDVIPLSH